MTTLAQETPHESSPAVSIRPVRNEADLKTFIDFPWKVYADNPHWVPPLKDEVRQTLTDENPFWQHAERELFLAEREGRLVGRIAAIVDQGYVRHHKDGCGFFGFFEVLEDQRAATALLEAASSWVGAKGMRAIRGPASPSMGEECGILTDAYDNPPAIMMGYNPPYYRNLVENAGFKKEKDLYSYIIESKGAIPDRINRLCDRVEKRNRARLRHLNKRQWDSELRIVREIYNSAWEDAWGFTPLTDAEIEHTAKKLKPIVDPEAVHFVEVNGEPVAFSLLLPDVNQVLHHLDGKLGVIGALKFLYYYRKINRVRLIALGIKEKYRNKGIDVLLYREAWLTARRKGWDGDLGWVREDNEMMNRALQALDGRIYKTYRIYKKPLA